MDATTLTLDAQGQAVVELQQLLQQLGETIPPAELTTQKFGPGTQAALKAAQASVNMPATGVFDAVTAGALRQAIIIRNPPPRTVAGRIVLDQGAFASGVLVRAYDIAFGDKPRQLGQAVTDAAGKYSIQYRVGGAVNVEIRAVAPDEKEVSLSAPTFNAPPALTLNLVAPSTLHTHQSEFDRLAADLTKHVGAIENLGAAVESEQQRDLTLLKQATGWDARVIALAAQASQLAATTKMTPASTYALLRVGLPADATQLALVGAGGVQAALQRARANGIVSLDDNGVAAAVQAYKSYAAAAIPKLKGPGMASSYGDLLKVVGLNGDQQQKLQQLYFAPDRPQGAAFWKQLADAGFPSTAIEALKLQGKLAFLTLNNATIAASLAKEIGSAADLGKLVPLKLYDPAAWRTRVQAAAGNDPQKLADAIPSAYVADNVDDRLNAYAADLARKVRIAFPTQVVSHLIATDALSLGDTHAQLKTPVTAFLDKATGLGFQLGRQPLSAFIAKHHDALFAGVSKEVEASTTTAVKRLQRLYQIAPSNESLKMLYDHGFDSAHDVARFDEDRFLDRFGSKLPSEVEARLLYWKSVQVSTVSYNFFTGAKQLDSGAAVYAVSPPDSVRQQAKQNIIESFPTMASLFGSLDYCQCEECRSVLSPAAYLVDLLQFIDPSALVWQDFVAWWSQTHGGADYNASYLKPYDELVARRPDLPQLPLTCANTNTELPYIDVVNEILEYYVANGALAAAAVHDTGDANSDDLIAEPQNIIPDAYDKLKQARYPAVLPFDLWIETVRRFCDHFGTPLSTVLEAFRTSDELVVPAATYDRAAIFVESLEIAPVERALFKDPNPLAQWFGLYGYPTEAAALAALPSAKTLADRLGLSYQELIDVVGTAFVNPKLSALVFLNKLGVGIDDVFRYKGQAGWPPFTAAETQAFEDKLTALSATYAPFDAKAWLDQTWTAGGFNGSLVLADPDTAGCDFSSTVLRYAEGTAADPLAYLRLALFVRLWRKLGWTMEETDRALSTFIPSGSLPLTATTIGPALDTALVYCAHLQALATALGTARLPLLTLWGPLATTGKSPLYAQLFLTPSVLGNDPVFDDPLGHYLSQPGLVVGDHLLAIQGALNLSANDVTAILAAAGQTPATAPLTLATVSLLYRHGVVAKALHLSVPDLLTLKALSGLDPFAALDPAPLSTLARDQPFSSTLAFTTLAARIAGSGLGIADLDYLARQNVDPVGPYRDDPNALIAFVLALADGLHQVATDNAVPDAAALTDDLLREKLSLVLTADVVETFLAMMAGTVQYEASVGGVAPGSAIDPATLAGEPALTPIYDAVRNAQDLVYRGVLVATEKTRLETAHPGALLAQLLDGVEAQAHAFFDKYLAAFLQPADFDLLFTPIPPGTPDAAAQAQLVAKRTRLAQAFFPYLQKQLADRFIIETVAAAESADPTLTETLLGQAALLHDPATPTAPLSTTLAAAGDRGVTAQYFASTDGSGAPLGTAAAPTADTSGKPAGTNSARFDGFLVVPATGAYRFFARIDKQNATVLLEVGDGPSPVLFGTAASDGAELSDFVELKAGVPYAFHFSAGSLNGGDVALLVQSQALPKDTLAQLTLYPAASIDAVRRARLLFDKALLVVGKLGLSESELSYLVANGADFDGLDLSQLPTSPGIAAAAAQANFTRLLRLIGYAALKKELAVGGDDLVGVFAHARRTFPAGTAAATATATVTSDVTTLLANLTRREPAVVQAAATALGLTATATASATDLKVVMPGFFDERGLDRVWQVLKIVQRLGVPVSAVPGWTHIVGAITSQQAYDIARDVKHTVKAQYTVEQWRAVAKPIFDKLRARQRDALVAYCLQALGLDDVDRLFEYFLIDPGMEPVVLTSRLQLAIASVQTFIQRCLLNLELKVPAAAINAEYWEWMKRYRVWQANREIFLFPENWLEPEFRDDKTYLFNNLEAALLQGDVTNDLVEDAFFAYLAELDQIARLDVVAMYCEEMPLDPASNILHVVGRTYSAPHKYFYRTCQADVWTAWTPITAEIESDHVTLAKWHDRIQLLWVTFVTKNRQDPSASSKSFRSVADDTVGSKLDLEVSAQLHWSELYQGTWTSRRTSGLTQPTYAGASFDPSKVYIHVSKSYNDDGSEDALYVKLSGPVFVAFEIVSKNSDPEIAEWTLPLVPPYDITAVDASRFVGAGGFTVKYVQQIETVNGQPPQYTTVTDNILQLGGSFRVLMGSMPFDFLNRDPELSALASPFFYSDRKLTFFVEPTLTETRIDVWEGWIITPLYPAINQPWLENIPVKPLVPATVRTWPLPDPGDPADYAIDPSARFAKAASAADWVSDPSTIVSYKGRLVGAGGGLPAALQSVPRQASVTPAAAANQAVIVLGTNPETLPPVLNVVGAAGVTPSLARAIAGANGINHSLIAAGAFGSVRPQGAVR